MTRQERPKPIGKGEEQGRSPLGLPPQPVRQGRTREVQKPKRFLVKPEGREERSGSAEGRSPSAGSFFGLFDRFRDAEHNVNMIHSFTCLDTEALFRSQVVPRFKNIERVARRKLLQLHAATELASLMVPPGNQLEALKGDRRGQHSIRINDQWRICFVWHDDGAHQVEIVDYH